jgi:hypothetical protein
VSNNALTEILKDDLSYNPKHIMLVSQFTNSLSKMIEEKRAFSKPWLVFWVRLMRNKLYMKNSTKVETLVE